MDHRQLVNVVAFVVGFLCMVALGVATAASPSTWYAPTLRTGGTSSIRVAFDAACTIDTQTYYPTKGEAAAAASCDAVLSDSQAIYTPKGPAFNYMDVSWRIEYSCVLINGGSACGDGFMGGNYYTKQLCWDGVEPVGGVCPEPPMCPPDLTVDWFFTSRATLPSSVCDRQSCRWDQSAGVSLCLPEDLTCVGAYTSTGDYCQGGTITLDAQALDKPFAEYIDPPVTETTVDKPAPVINGDTVTDQSVTTTETDRAVKIERTVNDTTVTETGVHGVTKTTTTTTTTHADGSQTITETVSYQQTTPDVTTTRIGLGGSVRNEEGKTISGSTSTTTLIGADGSITSTMTETGVGGDGEGGPEDGEGGECKWLPDFICDWFREPEYPEDVELPIIESVQPEYDSGLPASGSCPPGFTVDLGAFGSPTISLQPLCDLAVAIKPLVIAISYLAAAFIVVGGRGK